MSIHVLTVNPVSFTDINPFRSYSSMVKQLSLLTTVLSVQFYAGALLYACSASDIDDEWLSPLGPSFQWFFSRSINAYTSLGYNFPLHIYYTLQSFRIFEYYWDAGVEAVKNRDIVGGLHWFVSFASFAYILYASILVYTGLSDENAEECDRYNFGIPILRLLLVGLGFIFFNASGSEKVRQVFFELLSHPFRHFLAMIDFAAWSKENQALILNYWGKRILHERRCQAIDRASIGYHTTDVSVDLSAPVSDQSTAKTVYWYIAYPLITLDIAYLFASFSRTEAENGYSNMQLFISLLVNMAIAFIAANNLWDAFISILWPDKEKGFFIHRHAFLAWTYKILLSLFFIFAPLSGGAVYDLLLTYIANKWWAVLIGIPGLVAFNTSGFSDLIMGGMTFAALLARHSHGEQAPKWAKDGVDDVLVAHIKAALKTQPLPIERISIDLLGLPDQKTGIHHYLSALAQLIAMISALLSTQDALQYPGFAIFGSCFVAKLAADAVLNGSRYSRYNAAWAACSALVGFSLTTLLLFYGHFIKTGNIELEFSPGILSHWGAVALGMAASLICHFSPNKLEPLLSNNNATLYRSSVNNPLMQALLTASETSDSSAKEWTI